jgi:hypothetical protein
MHVTAAGCAARLQSTYRICCVSGDGRVSVREVDAGELVAPVVVTQRGRGVVRTYVSADVRDLEPAAVSEMGGPTKVAVTEPDGVAGRQFRHLLRRDARARWRDRRRVVTNVGCSYGPRPMNNGAPHDGAAGEIVGGICGYALGGLQGRGF